ncbi:MAG: GNAT family protein, partial [Bacteroidota bacterium]
MTLTGMLSVREIAARDLDLIADYWTLSNPDFLESMGVDLAKVPPRKDLLEMLSQQLNQKYEDKKSFGIIWELDGKAVGHCNINKIIFGNEAYMHLHLWYYEQRRRGVGSVLVKMTLPHFFNHYRLKKLYCEPYALNTAPNKTLEKVGFNFVKQYRTIPGYLNFEQDV